MGCLSVIGRCRTYNGIRTHRLCKASLFQYVIVFSGDLKLWTRMMATHLTRGGKACHPTRGKRGEGEAPNWRAFLAKVIREEDRRPLRAREHTGRPLGGEEFLATLEQSLGRILRRHNGKSGKKCQVPLVGFFRGRPRGRNVEDPEKVSGTIVWLLTGRPRGRNVDSSPSREAVRFCQGSVPYG